MTDKKTTLTNEDRRFAHEWAKSVESNPRSWTARILAAARVILDTVPALPTLADMSHVARRETRWMRCDVDGEDGEWLIIDPFDDESHVHVVGRRGNSRIFPTHHITPRPDLARMEWEGTVKPAPTLPGDWKLADHPEHGRVVVTNPIPTSDGRVYYAKPAPGILGRDGSSCAPGKLTYFDQ